MKKTVFFTLKYIKEIKFVALYFLECFKLRKYSNRIYFLVDAVKGSHLPPRWLLFLTKKALKITVSRAFLTFKLLY